MKRISHQSSSNGLGCPSIQPAQRPSIALPCRRGRPPLFGKLQPGAFDSAGRAASRASHAAASAKLRIGSRHARSPSRPITRYCKRFTVSYSIRHTPCETQAMRSRRSVRKKCSQSPRIAGARSDGGAARNGTATRCARRSRMPACRSTKARSIPLRRLETQGLLTSEWRRTPSATSVSTGCRPTACASSASCSPNGTRSQIDCTSRKGPSDGPADNYQNRQQDLPRAARADDIIANCATSSPADRGPRIARPAAHAREVSAVLRFRQSGGRGRRYDTHQWLIGRTSSFYLFSLKVAGDLRADSGYPGRRACCSVRAGVIARI